MKNIISFIFVLGFTILTFAQKSVSGIITDGNGKPLPSASVTIEEPGKNSILAYGITNTKGEYKINFTSTEAEVFVKVKAFNQKPTNRTIKNVDQNLNFSLTPETTEIEEVRIKTKLITKRGDTIAYDLKSFENKNDRTLADVLKKIPGIEVNKDGTVLYQGEAINKFYVNGKDLMEGGYGTINNSLPKDAVSKVEVMENHQPVKILQDKVPSENAAINIKLKKSVTMTGRGEVGAGFSPLLWNVKLTPMFFGQKNQWIVNYKANNNGEAVEREGNMLSFGSRWEGRRSQSSQKSWIGVETAGTPGIPEKRYLLNNVHFFSANLLTNPFKNKEWELKANASYTNNSVERQDFQTNVYGINSNTIEGGGTFTSSTRNNFYTNAAKGELIFSKNAKLGFFKNTTTWNSYWNDNRADVDNYIPRSGAMTQKLSGQSLNSPTGTFQNSLSTIIPWKDKLFNVMSFVKYQKDRQTMDVTPGSYMSEILPVASNYNTMRQHVASNSLTLAHSASVGFTYKQWTFTPEVGLNLGFNEMQSAVNGINNGSVTDFGTEYHNDMEWNEVQPYTQVGVNFKSSNINLSATLPINFYGITYRDFVNNKFLDQNKTVFEPNLFASYDFASFFKLMTFAGQSYDFGNFGFLYGGKMFTNPTNLTVRYSDDVIMPEYINRYVGSRLEYRNPLNNLFFNVRYNYSTNGRNLIESYTRNGFVSQLELIARDITTKSQSESAEIGKYFPSFKTNLSVNFNNTDSNSFSILNDNEREITNNNQSMGVKFNNTFFSWISVDYNINLNWGKSRNKVENFTNKSAGWSHNLATYIYPSANHTFGFNWDDLTSGVGGKKYRNSFYDVSYQYTWVKKKIDFEFKWLNIANKKVYETIGVDALQDLITTNQIYIRPSQFMFTVKFNFK